MLYNKTNQTRPPGAVDTTLLPVQSGTGYPYPTYYFRTHFTWGTGDPTQTTLTLTTDIDDGGIAYLNGHEVLNMHMATTSPTYSSFDDGWNNNDSSPVETWTFPGTYLVAGDNVLAVEVHQHATNSSDITWCGILDAVTTTGSNTYTATIPANISNLDNYLRVTEVMYNPAGDPDLEFIELQNIGTASLDLTGVRINGGVSFTFPAVQLAAGQYVVVARNATKFTDLYGPGVNLAGQYTGHLGNTGDDIDLELPAPYDTDILRFSYLNTWVPASNGEGYSMVIRSASAPAASWNDPSSWQAGAVVGGTPGRAEGLSDVVINEVLSHTDQPLYDSVELYNKSTTNTVDVSGWYLTDSSSILKYRIPNNTVLTPGQYKVIDGHDFAIADYNGVNDGANDVEDSGATLHQVGNGWEQVSLRDPLTYAAYPVTANTTLEFDFKAPVVGAMQGIGLGNSDTADPGQTFQLDGSASFGIPVTYSSVTADGWYHYVINVGSDVQLLGTAMTRLFFANDSTGTFSDAECYFRNVEIYETAGTPRIFDFSKYFGLNAHQGDNVWLIQADASGSAIRFDDHVAFGAAVNGESFGRWPNGTGNLYPLQQRTLGAANNSNGNAPRVGPVVISEVMYEPTALTASEIAAGFASADDMQYVEVYNPTATAVDLSHWHLVQGITYDFADGASLPAHQSLAIVAFDPANAAQRGLPDAIRHGGVLLACRSLQRHAGPRRGRGPVAVRRSDGSRHAGLLARPAGRRGHL